MGKQGLPTIVSPKLYRQRFTEAMDRYFLVAPDRWEGLEKQPIVWTYYFHYDHWIIFFNNRINNYWIIMTKQSKGPTNF